MEIYIFFWNMIIPYTEIMKLFGINFEMTNAYNISIIVESGIIIPVF